MKKQGFKKLGIIAASSLIVLSLTASPVRADHDSHANIVVPIATFVALGLLLNHNRHNRPRYGHYSSYRNQYHGHKHKQHRPKRHSYSRGGYQGQGKRRYQH